MTEIEIAERLSALETTSSAHQETLSEISSTLKQMSAVIAENAGNQEQIRRNDLRLDALESSHREFKTSIETRLRVWGAVLAVLIAVFQIVLN